MRIASALVVLSLPLLVTSCRSIANADECEAVSKHLAELQVQKERKPPLGQLASPIFDTPENAQRIFDEAKKNARDRCAKGWKRAVAQCMLDAKDLAAADKCRFE